MLVGFGLLLSACTEPMYRVELLDGGSSDARVTPGPDEDGDLDDDMDGGEAPTPTHVRPPSLPSWASPLRGTYALRVRYYGYQHDRERSTQIVARATISPGAVSKEEPTLKT